MSFRRPGLRACDKALATFIQPKSQYCSACRALRVATRSSPEIKLSKRTSSTFVSKPNYSSRFSTSKYTTRRASLATHTKNMSEPTVHPLFEPVTGTWQYIVADSSTKKAVIIDSVLNYDPIKAKVTTESADAILEIVQDKGYHIDMILETHAHADHLTAASYLQSKLAKNQGSKPAIGIGSRIKQVQTLFGEKYGVLGKEYETVFDRFWSDDDEFAIGTLTARAVHLPGHTPDHMGYQVGSNIFVGDSIFHVDIGSARADFPGGSAQDIYKSGRKLLALPEDTKIWVGHDYPPEGRDAPVPFATVKEHRQNNKHLKDGTQEHEFVEMRSKRDATLAAPRLIHPSLQVNIRGGQLPAPSPSGVRMVHLPLTGPSW